ncbi:MAG: ABC transporter substrate-binding protein [Clostridia bacterium]
MRRILAVAVFGILLLSMPVSAQKTTVTVWFAGTPQGFMDVINNELVPEFEAANPNTDLTVSFVPWGELSTKLATAFAGGVAPDVFMHGGAATAGFAASGRLEPLDSYFAGWPDAADFGATLDAGLYEGKRYLLPMFGAGRLLVYRADFFREAGLDPAKPPTTWEELRAAAGALAVKKDGRLVREGLDLPIAGIDAQQIWAGLLWQNGGDFFNEDCTKAVFNNAAGVAALEFLVGFIHRDGVTDTRYDVGQSTAPPPMALGKTAMFFAVPEELNQIKTYSPDVYKEVRVAPPLKHKAQATLYSFSGLFLSKDSKHKAQAWEAIKFFGSKTSLAKINASMGTLPPRKSLATADFIARDPNIKVFVESMQYGKPNPNIPTWVKCRDAMSRYIEKAVFGQLSPKEALDQAAAEVDKILAQQ